MVRWAPTLGFMEYLDTSQHNSKSHLKESAEVERRQHDKAQECRGLLNTTVILR